MVWTLWTAWACAWFRTGRAAQLRAVDLGLALGCLSRRQGCRQHRAVQGSPKSSLLSSSPVNAAIDSSGALTLSSTQLGKLEPSSGCGADQQCMAEQSPSFRHANCTLSEGAFGCVSAGLSFRL